MISILLLLLRKFGLAGLLGIPKKILSTDRYLQYYFSTYTPQKQILFPQEYITVSRPKTIEQKIDWKFESLLNRYVPEAFIIRLDKGKVWGADGAVVTAENIVLQDVSRQFGQRHGHSIFKKLLFNHPKHIQGNVAVLATAGGSTYYHWMFDILPRIYLLKQAGIFCQIDFFVLPELSQPFQKQTLELMGIEIKQIISMGPKTYLSADNLFVPSLPSLLGTVSPWAVNFISKAIKPTVVPFIGKKIYISRRNDSLRGFINEDEIINFLEEHGFIEIVAEKYSISEQAHIFSQANVIIAAHGSGLSNIAFCRPQTVVVDLLPAGFVVPCFWTIATALNLDYYYLTHDDSLKIQFNPYWLNKASRTTFPIIKLKLLISSLN